MIWAVPSLRSGLRFPLYFAWRLPRPYGSKNGFLRSPFSAHGRKPNAHAPCSLQSLPRFLIKKLRIRKRGIHRICHPQMDYLLAHKTNYCGDSGRRTPCYGRNSLVPKLFRFRRRVKMRSWGHNHLPLVLHSRNKNLHQCRQCLDDID